MNIAKKMFRMLFVQFIVFICLVIVLDLGLWILFPVSDDIHEWTYEAKQNLPGLKESILIETRKYGIRSLSEVDENKPDNMIRILCLGASTTIQFTQETQDTWCGILETKLREYYSDSDLMFQTMAFGQGGFRASDDAFWVKKIFDEIAPDVVITLLGINDLALNGGETYRYVNLEEVLSGKNNIEELENAVKLWFKEYSQICRRIVWVKRNLDLKKKLQTGEKVEWHSNNLPKLRGNYRSLPYVETLERNPDPIIEFSDTVDWLSDFFVRKQVRVIMLGQPVLWKPAMSQEEFENLWFSIATPNGKVRPSGAWLLDEMTKYNFVQEVSATKHGFVYIDLDKKIPKTTEYFFDDCHFTDIGSEYVANKILPELINITKYFVSAKRRQGVSHDIPAVD